MILKRLEMAALKINKNFFNYSILDAGCRTMNLKPLLQNCREYFGSDITATDGVLKIDLNNKLPFDDNSFDLVACLDVLEHLDNPHQALRELIRVAKYSVFISLPNIYHLTFRYRFLKGGGISGKYKFPEQFIQDRHRWIMSYDEILAFIRSNCPNFIVEQENILTIYGRFKKTVGPIEKILAKIFPNLFVYGVFFEIKLKNFNYN
jgi:SAM-dependent methyltransferase